MCDMCHTRILHILHIRAVRPRQIASPKIRIFSVGFLHQQHQFFTTLGASRHCNRVAAAAAGGAGQKDRQAGKSSFILAAHSAFFLIAKGLCQASTNKCKYAASAAAL